MEGGRHSCAGWIKAVHAEGAGNGRGWRWSSAQVVLGWWCCPRAHLSVALESAICFPGVFCLWKNKSWSAHCLSIAQSCSSQQVWRAGHQSGDSQSWSCPCTVGFHSHPNKCGFRKPRFSCLPGPVTFWKGKTKASLGNFVLSPKAHCFGKWSDSAFVDVRIQKYGNGEKGGMLFRI